MTEEISRRFNEAMKALEDEQEAYWNSLTKEQQLKAFCAVSRRIFQGEIKEKRSYRGVLYDVFGFGPDAYVQAQDAGYLAIHNGIFTPEQEVQMLEAFAKHVGLPEDAVTKYIGEVY